MRLTLKRGWHPRALSSFLGFMDLKTGVTIALLFALLNKVAGVYGLIAIFNGGTLAQLSMYIYSVAALAAFAWGMKAVTEEDPKRTFYFAHIFLGDHLLNTIWTVFFGVQWWVYNPHDGKRIANSAAQQDMINAGGPAMSDAERLRAAQEIWNKEKGLAATFLFTGWFIKIYFAILIYSFAVHLRKGSYRSLPLTNPLPEINVAATAAAYSSALAAADDFSQGDDDDDFYHMPLRTGGSVSSTTFIDPRTNGNGNGNGQTSPLTSKSAGKSSTRLDSVLWDEDEDTDEGSGPILPLHHPVGDLASGRGDAPPEESDESDRGDIGGPYGGSRKSFVARSRA